MPIRTAKDKNYGSLPIVRPDFTSGMKIDAIAENSAHIDTDQSGAFVITPTVNVMLAIGGDASLAAGSIYLPAGSAYHTLVNAAEKISVIATSDAGPVYLAPLL